MVNTTPKQIGLAAGIPIRDQPGRLAHEIAKNKANVIALLYAGILKAQSVMGITAIDTNKNKTTAQEAISKILEVYPGAMIADILKALEMASYREIVLTDQLNTVSASNIFGWYKDFRLNHADKMSSPQPIPQKAMPEPTAEEKQKLARDFFIRCLTSPDEVAGGLDLVFQDMAKMGVFRDLKNQMVFALKMVVERLAISEAGSLSDHRKRMQYTAISAAFKQDKSLEEIKQMSGFQNAAYEAKKHLIKQAVDMTGKEQLIEIYDNQKTK